LLGAALLLVSATGAGAVGRPRLSLDGTWQFKLDPGESGEKARWFSETVPFEGRIKVPGAWDAQGYGTETAKVRHNFVGKGWYRRSVRIPDDWRGKRVFLTIGGVHRYAKVWVNNGYLGEHIGYLSPFEYEITRQVAAGEVATIALCMDSKQRWDVDALTGCFDIIDAMHVNWGGIWGHVALEARSGTWLEDLFVQPKIGPPSCRVSARLAGGKIGDATVRLEVVDSGGRLLARSELPLRKALNAEEGIRIDAAIPGARPWSPNSPHLYTARLSLLRGREIVDQVETRFGLREIEIRGPHFYLNGKKLFLHGYGDDCVYPETLAAPSDKAVYLKRLRVAKAYGFNYVRHHSHFLPPEYYEAADEVGMLVSPELPIAYLSYYRRAKGAALDCYKKEWAAAIRRLRNHPSIFDWCMGNEMWDGVPLAPELYRIAKGLDPTRPVIDSNGLSGRGWLDGSRDRHTLDFYVVTFGPHHLPLDRPGKHRFAKPKKPVISHETGNYVTFPRLDLIAEFKHSVKPFWLTPARKRLEQRGLLGEAQLWARNSERLYLLCHKLNIEDIRRNPFLSGHQWWLLQDYWTGSNGIVDAYFRPKRGIPPERVRQFNGDVVLLLDGLELTYRGKQPFDAKVLVSNYSEAALKKAALKWQARLDGRALARGEEKGVEVGQGEVEQVAAIEISLPDAPVPQALTIEAELIVGDRTYRNDWSAWVYPAAIKRPQLKVPLYASPELVRPLAAYGARPLPRGEKLPAGAVYVMRQPTLRAFDAAAAGACLVLLSPQGLFQAARTRFKTAWWLGSARDSNVGTVVYDNPITRAVAPDGWCDAGWYRLLEGAQTYILDELPTRPEVLVRGIEVHSLCRSKALLFQARVGEGALIVSGLNLLFARGQQPPEAEWLLARLIEHAGTLPKPRAELPLTFFRKRIARAAPPKGPYLLGFRRLIRNEGEESIWHSYREDNTRFYICRQTAPGHLVEWETARVPDALKGRAITFVFAGGLGWRSEPRTKGFAFLVNGREVIDFDITQVRATWKSKDEKVALHFVPLRRLPLDGVGLFYVTVAPDLLAPGKPCRLGVRSKGSQSRRWFGLNPYTDILGGHPSR